jgi:hypothetical protein
MRYSKHKSLRTLYHSVNDISSAGRLHKILAKDPRVRCVPLLIPSGENTSSGQEALKLMLDTHVPGSEVLNECSDIP